MLVITRGYSSWGLYIHYIYIYVYIYTNLYLGAAKAYGSCHDFNVNFRIPKWRYVSTILVAIFRWDIPWNLGRYLQTIGSWNGIYTGSSHPFLGSGSEPGKDSSGGDSWRIDRLEKRHGHGLNGDLMEIYGNHLEIDGDVWESSRNWWIYMGIIWKLM